MIRISLLSSVIIISSAYSSFCGRSELHLTAGDWAYIENNNIPLLSPLVLRKNKRSG